MASHPPRPRLGRALELTLALAILLALGGEVHGRAGAVEVLEGELAHARAAGAPALERAEIQHRLGRALAKARRYDEAAAAFEQALAVREAELPPNDPDLVASLTGLAVARAGQDRNEEAEAHLRRALELRERGAGEDAPEVATAVVNLGAFYTQLERYDEAEALLERAIAIHEKAGSDPEGLVLALRNRAALYDRRGQPEAGDALYRRILEVRRAAETPDAARVASAHAALARRHRERGDAGAAERHYREALEILGGDPAPPGVMVVRSLAGLAWALHRRGRIEEAGEYYRRALEIGDHALGRDDPRLVPVLDGYAALLRDARRADEAAALEARAGRLRGDVAAGGGP